MTLTQKVGQLFMPAAFINDTEEEIQELEKLIQRHDVGGLCFFHSRASAATNFEGKKVVLQNERSYDRLKTLIGRYQTVAQFPLLIAIDAEWGLAMRIENTPQYPYAITLGAIENNTDLTFKVGQNIAKDCKVAGIHWNLSPVVDINNNPNNPVIGYRSFGENREAVVANAISYVKGTQSEGILTSVKHFPGHGDTSTDSHLGLPLINKSKNELLKKELYPFRKLIDEGVDSIMVGHLSVPALANGKKISASLSKDIIKGVLRQEMGFEGIVISDALNMHAVSKNHPIKGELEWLAFDAGNDILCFAENVSEGIATIVQNATQKQVEESFARIWRLKSKAILKRGTKGFNLTNPDSLNQKVAEKSLTLYKGSEANIIDFSKKDFIYIENFNLTENQFIKSILEHKKFNCTVLGDKSIETHKNILLALYPPQIKPTNNFGLSAEELESINTLIKTKNVVLYLFGNPYVLNHIDFKNIKAIVVVYQNFKVFQETAALHFLGKFKASGKLPVKVSLASTKSSGSI